MIPYNKYIRDFAQTFKSITFKHVPRESNQVTNALATLSAMFNVANNEEIQPIKIKKREELEYCMRLSRSLMEKQLAVSFFLSEEVLYKRNYDMILLRCMDALEANIILEEVHEGVCGAHINRHMMERQILRASFYWLTMNQIASSTQENFINVKYTLIESML